MDTETVYIQHIRAGSTKEFLDEDSPHYMATACGLEVGFAGQPDLAWGEDAFRGDARVERNGSKCCADCFALLVGRDLEEAYAEDAALLATPPLAVVLPVAESSDLAALRSALADVDKLHIEWGGTDMDEINQLELWERLGRILRKAGV